MKTIKRFGRLLLAAVALSALTVAPNAFAASNVEGTIAVTAVTSNGTPVAGAAVQVQNSETGFSRQLSTDANGKVRFPALAVGDYQVTVTKSGYQDATQKATVSVGSTTPTRVTLLAEGESATELGSVTVTGGQISPIDLSSTESSLNLSESTIDRLPVSRSLMGVTMLAPSTTRPDDRFGSNLPSFGGASAGENACYLNGLDITNFRTGIGCQDVPHEFYKEFQIKTGGFDAEFGRATGGVVNAVTKSGSNEFHWGANMYWEPWIKNVNGTTPNSYQIFGPVGCQTGTSGAGCPMVTTPGGALSIDNRFDENSSLDFNVYVSGPLVKDKLFYYLLVNPRSLESKNYSAPGGYYVKAKTDNPFYGLKLDYFITDNHKLALTAFSNSHTTTYKQYDYVNGSGTEKGDVTGYVGNTKHKRGGDNAVLQYTGYFGPNFTLSASYGISKFNMTNLSADAPISYNSTTGQTYSNALGTSGDGNSKDERDQWRIDAQWYLGDHTLKFGADYQTRKTDNHTGYPGSTQYTSPYPYFSQPGTQGPTFTGGNLYRVFSSSNSVYVYHLGSNGSYQTENNALYLSDKWQITNNFMLSLGLRSESFNNKNADGESFIKLDNQIAPRLGFSWDIAGDGMWKMYGNFGRYYLGVANNTNVRAAGGETFFIDVWSWDGTIGNNGVPGLGTYAGTIMLEDGHKPDPSTLVTKNIDPMYQDEYILGFQHDLGNGWNVGVRGTYRDLKSTIDDTAIGTYASSGALYYALFNPGKAINLCPTEPFTLDDPNTSTVDANGCVHVDANAYPQSTRKYAALEFLFDKTWDGVWYLQGSYTWSHNWGNNEGYVKSDNGQTDGGVTSNFDYPGLTDYTYGNLPSDRRHTFKLYGAWAFAPNWQAGMNVIMQSGRPYAALGVHPTDPLAASYGVESFFQNGQPVPRGSRGTTPFNTNVDLSLKYMTELAGGDLTLGLDVFNVFNSVNATQIDEEAEVDDAYTTSSVGPGSANRTYTMPTYYQTPRYIRLSAEIDF